MTRIPMVVIMWLYDSPGVLELYTLDPREGCEIDLGLKFYRMGITKG